MTLMGLVLRLAGIALTIWIYKQFLYVAKAGWKGVFVAFFFSFLVAFGFAPLRDAFLNDSYETQVVISEHPATEEIVAEADQVVEQALVKLNIKEKEGMAGIEIQNSPFSSGEVHLSYVEEVVFKEGNDLETSFKSWLRGKLAALKEEEIDPSAFPEACTTVFLNIDRGAGIFTKNTYELVLECPLVFEGRWLMNISKKLGELFDGQFDEDERNAWQGEMQDWEEKCTTCWETVRTPVQPEFQAQPDPQPEPQQDAQPEHPESACPEGWVVVPGIQYLAVEGGGEWHEATGTVWTETSLTGVEKNGLCETALAGSVGTVFVDPPQ